MKIQSHRDTLRTKVLRGMNSLGIVAAVFLACGQTRAHAGYSMAWSRIAGGGGTSSSAQYTLSGTIGQYDAGGPMQGGNLILTGGFWSDEAVQTPGVPSLRIFATGNGPLVVAWPGSPDDWRLEQCSDLATAAWSVVNGTVTVVGAENQFVIPYPSGDRFFRLTRATANNP